MKKNLSFLSIIYFVFCLCITSCVPSLLYAEKDVSERFLHVLSKKVSAFNDTSNISAVAKDFQRQDYSYPSIDI